MAFSRRDFLSTTAAAIGAGLLVRPTLLDAWQQAGGRMGGQGSGQAAPPQWTPVFTEIRNGAGYFTGRGGTIGYLIRPAAVVAVDSQFADSAPTFVAGLQERTKNRGVDRLFNTHHHGDHTGGNNAFRDVAKRVVAHANATALIKAAAERQGAAPQLVPDTTFTDVWREDIGGNWVRAKYYGAAHTNGDAVITFEGANVAHMGDLMFNRRVPVIDRTNGARVANWITVLEGAVKDHTADTVFIFGHAGANFPITGSNKELMHFRDYLTALLDHTRAAIKAGQTREQFIAAPLVLPKFEDFGQHTANTLGIVYDEMKG